MGVASSRSPAMAYADGELWCSTLDEAGNRCWVHSETGERVYHFVGGKPARRPSNTSTTSPYTMQDPNQPWANPGPAMLSPRHVLRSPGPAQRSPGPAHRSPGPVHRSPGPVHRSPGHVHRSPGPVLRSPGPVHHNSGPVHHSPGPVMLSPGPVHHSPGPIHHSPGPATFSAGYGGAPNYPAGTTMVPYEHQPGYGEGAAPGAQPAPTATGEAVGYRSSNVYIRPRNRAWMWTP